MDTIQSISVSDALEQLIYPSFFDSGERKAAYNFVMLWGNDSDRLSAEQAKNKYPFDEPEAVFSYSTDQDFPIVSKAQHA